MDFHKEFLRVYHQIPDAIYFSPGRVNIIGEHIDYNGGLVLPAAISLGTYGVIRLREDNNIRVFSTNFKDLGIINVSIDDLSYKSEDHYVNYIKGVFALCKKKHDQINFGMDIYIHGTLPPQSGLSSSASLLVLIVFILSDVFKLKLSKTDIALYAKDVENNYMQMHCGIMDQLIIAKGIKHKALLMNTSTLETNPINAFINGYSWVIMNSHYERKTTESKYNERVKECQDALNIVKTLKKVHDLCELSINDYNDIEHLLNNSVLKNRTRHVVTEQQRVLETIQVLKNQDAQRMGELLNASHQSLKVDYEVTGFHLDMLQEGALLSGAIGARVTGAGFGGCAIALVKTELLETFDQLTDAYYYEKTKLHASFYHVEFVDGVSKIEVMS